MRSQPLRLQSREPTKASSDDALRKRASRARSRERSQNISDSDAVVKDVDSMSLNESSDESSDGLTMNDNVQRY